MRCNNRLCEYNSRYNNDGCNKLSYALSQEKCETKKRWRKKIPLDALLGKAHPKADVLLAEKTTNNILMVLNDYTIWNDLNEEQKETLTEAICVGVDTA